MNHVFRLIWSNVSATWVAVAENSHGRQKKSRRRQVPLALLTLACCAVFLPADAAPLNGQLVSGAASVTQHGATTTITQTSPTVALNWSGFNIAPSETVNFIQPSPSAVAVNRINSGNASGIFGQLNANGQVYLINPSGILFGQGAQVNVGGLLASTLDLNGAVDGPLRKFSGGGTGSVINMGHINAAPGGYVVLQGNQVSNQGTISAQLGTVALAAGSAVTLNFGGDSLLGLQVDGSNVRTLAENRDLILAEGGQVIMSAGARDSLLAGVVQNSGMVEAHSLQNHQGVIVLSAAGVDSSVNLGGKLDVSASAGQGGSIAVGGHTITLANASLDAGGSAGGGTITIGGGAQGQAVPGLVTADKVLIDAGSRINADALHSGDGGQVTVWSNKQTDFDGAISARALGSSGNGGSAEVSAAGLLNYRGATNLLAAHGGAGTLLLDPYEITISGGASSNMSGFTAVGDNSGLNVNTLLNALGMANVTVSTGTGGTQGGTITLAGALAWTAPTTLTLSASGGITLNAPITALAGGLSLSAGPIQTIAGNNIIRVGSFTVVQGNFRQTASVLPDFYAPSFNIGPNGTFLRAAGGDGSTGAPFILTDIYGLQGIGTNGVYLNASYALANNIDASITSGWSSGAGFMPIGTATAPFGGSLDGRNYAITNLLINRPTLSSGVGLFGYVNNGTLSNLSLLNASVTGGGAGNGILAGLADGSSSISGIVTTGVISGANSSTVDNVGGIVGAMTGTAALSASSSAASVTGYHNNVGGAVGSSAVASTISSTSSSGAVSGLNNTGGLVGLQNGSLNKSYATGAVAAGSGGSNSGGLVGNNTGTINTTYSSGALSGSATNAGGFVGANTGTISNSCWDTTLSGQATGFGTNSGSLASLSGQTTAAMHTQSTFSGWDFSNDWGLVSTYAPVLRAGTTILNATGNLALSTAGDSSANLNTGTLQSLLGFGNVLVNAGGSLSAQNAVTWSTASRLSLLAGAAVNVSSGANLSATGAGGLGLVSSADGIAVNNATLSTASGQLTLFAPNSGAHAAIALTGATLNSDSGGTLLQGAGSSGAGLTLAGANNLATTGALTANAYSSGGNGILMVANSTLTSSGAVTLNGKSTDPSGTVASVLLTGNNTVTTSAGNLSINGGDSTDAGAGIAGTGTLALVNNGSGVLALGGNSNSANGIDISGTGSLSTTSTSGTVNLSGNSSNGAKDISIAMSGNASFGAGALKGTNGRGIQIASSAGSLSFANDLINTDNGLLTLSATAAGNTNAISFNNVNIDVNNGAAIITGGTSAAAAIDFSGTNSFKTSDIGNMVFNGTATAPFTAFARGILFESGSAVSTDGTVTMNGTSNYFVGIGFCTGTCATPVLLTDHSGSLTLNGLTTSSPGFGSGIDMYGATVTNAGAGILTLAGTSTSSTVGMYVNSPVFTLNDTGAGSIVVRGTAASGAGLYVDGSSITTNGSVSIAGTSTTGTGLALNGANAITDGSGNLSVSGGDVNDQGRGLYATGALTLANTGSGVMAVSGVSSSSNGLEMAGTTLSAASLNGVVNLSGSTSNGALDVKIANSGNISLNNGTLSGASAHGISVTSSAGTLGLASEIVSTSNGSLTLGAAANAITLTGDTFQVGSGTGLINALASTGTGITLNGLNKFNASGAGSLTVNGISSASGSGILLSDGSALVTSGTVNVNGQSSSGTGLVFCGGGCVSPLALTASSGNLSLSGATADAGATGLWFGGSTNVTNNGTGLVKFAGANSAAAGIALDLGAGASLTTAGAVQLTDASSSAATTAVRISGNVIDTAGALSLAPASQHGILIAGGAGVTSTGSGNLLLSTNGAGAIENHGTISQSGNGSGTITLAVVDGNLSNAGLISGAAQAGAISLRSTGAGAIADGQGRIAQAGMGAISLSASGTGSITSDVIEYSNAAANTLNISAVGDVTAANAISSTGGGLDTTLGSAAGALRLGSSIVTGNGAISLAGPVTLTGAESLDAGSSRISVASTINGPFGLDARARLLNFSGALGNAIPLSAVSLLSVDSLVLPSIRATSLLARSTAATADLSIAPGAMLSASGAGTAVTLAAGRNFLNQSGSQAISMSGPGRWLVYSADPLADQFNQLDSGHTAIWNSVYPAGVGAGGNRYVFAYQPTATLIGIDSSKVEGIDGSKLVAGSYVVSGLQAGVAGAYLGDTSASAFSGAPSLSSAGSAIAATIAGGPYAITLAQGTAQGINGYALQFQSGGSLTLVQPPPAEVRPAFGSQDILTVFENRYLPATITTGAARLNLPSREKNTQALLCMADTGDDLGPQIHRCVSNGK